MRTLREWLDEYSRSHVNPVNQKVHFVCIPLIMFSVICMLKAIPYGDDWLNAASIVMLAALAYYFWLSWQLAIGQAAVLGAFYVAALALQDEVGDRFIWVGVAVFIVGWIGQFIGHMIEGTRPSFFKDLQFLLIGPLWELAYVYRGLGIPVDDFGA